MTVFGVQVCACGAVLSYEGDRAGEREAKDAWVRAHSECAAPPAAEPGPDLEARVLELEESLRLAQHDRNSAIDTRDDAERRAEDLGKMNLVLQEKLGATVKAEVEVNRDAGTGQFVSDEAAAADPAGTVTETVEKPVRGRR